MELTKADILAFMQAWLKAFGELLTYEEAESEAKRLVAFALMLREEALRRGDTPLAESERIPD